MDFSDNTLKISPNVQEIIFQMVLSSSTKYILLMELKETQLMHIPCMCFFFFYLRSRWKSKSQILY